MHDTLCVERGKLEDSCTRGYFQTTAHTVRAFGGVVGAVMGAILYNKPIWGWGLDISGGLIPLFPSWNLGDNLDWYLFFFTFCKSSRNFFAAILATCFYSHLHVVHDWDHRRWSAPLHEEPDLEHMEHPATKVVAVFTTSPHVISHCHTYLTTFSYWITGLFGSRWRLCSYIPSSKCRIWLIGIFSVKSSCIPSLFFFYPHS